MMPFSKRDELINLCRVAQGLAVATSKLLSFVKPPGNATDSPQVKMIYLPFRELAAVPI